MSEILGRWSFPGAVRGIPDARHHVRVLCQQWFGYRDAIADVELLASEVMTNAIEHAQSAMVEMTVIAVSAAHVRVEVRDDGATGKNPALRQDRDETGGFGLFLVDAVSSEWGKQRGADGRLTVWFEVKLT